MELRRLGRSGLAVSVVGLGCNNFGMRIDAEQTTAVVHAALDAGITLFDTADRYGTVPGTSEELLGRALGARRDDVVLATKFGKPMQGTNGEDFSARGSRRYVRRAVTASLRRLGTDHIDLLWMHEPDPATPVLETLEALDDLVTEGLVGYVGSSQFAAWQVTDADWVARTAGTTRFVGAQNKYSLLDRRAEEELLPACRALGIGLVPYFPLESGLLTGKYTAGAPAPAGSRLADPRFSGGLAGAPWAALDRLAAVATTYGVDLLDLAVGGLASEPGVASVIAGATTPEQVRANATAGQFRADPVLREQLARVVAPAPATLAR